jgi:hypothetical protein
MSVTSNNSTINAGNNVEMVGGSQFKINGSVYNIDISAPQHGTSIENLQFALEQNRISVQEDLDNLIELIGNGYLLDNAHTIAVIKDAISGMRNIELLIPAIKLNGGRAQSRADEGNIAKKIEDAILAGIHKKENKPKQSTAKQNDLEEIIMSCYLIVALIYGYFWTVPEKGIFLGCIKALFWGFVFIYNVIVKLF